MSQMPPPKREVMMALLQHAESVFVNFDPRRDGVVVPQHLKRQPRVVLQYGLNMRIPIPDLDIGEEGIGATLSFEGRPTWTFLPWPSVFAIISQDQKGMLWESDLPTEIEAEHKQATAPGEAKQNAQPPATTKGGKRLHGGQRPALRAVEGGADKVDASSKSVPSGASEPTGAQAEPHERHEQDERAGESARPGGPRHGAGAKVAPAQPTKAARAKGGKAGRAPRPSLSVATPEAADRPPPEPQAAAPASPERPGDEIVEPPARDAKKKRELPPYLRVVK